MHYSKRSRCRDTKLLNSSCSQGMYKNRVENDRDFFVIPTLLSCKRTEFLVVRIQLRIVMYLDTHDIIKLATWLFPLAYSPRSPIWFSFVALAVTMGNFIFIKKVQKNILKRVFTTRFDDFSKFSSVFNAVHIEKWAKK